jgi:hypothetical protein
MIVNPYCKEDTLKLIKLVYEADKDMYTNLFGPTTTPYDIAYHKWVLLTYELAKRENEMRSGQIPMNVEEYILLSPYRKELSKN